MARETEMESGVDSNGNGKSKSGSMQRGMCAAAVVGADALSRRK